MPGINDDPKQVEEILELARRGGRGDVGGIALHLRGEVKDLCFEWLGRAPARPGAALPQLYRRGAYATKEERSALSATAGPRRAGGAAMPDPARPPEPAAAAAAASGVQASPF